MEDRCPAVLRHDDGRHILPLPRGHHRGDASPRSEAGRRPSSNLQTVRSSLAMECIVAGRQTYKADGSCARACSANHRGVGRPGRVERCARLMPLEMAGAAWAGTGAGRQIENSAGWAIVIVVNRKMNVRAVPRRPARRHRAFCAAAAGAVLWASGRCVNVPSGRPSRAAATREFGAARSRSGDQSVNQHHGENREGSFFARQPTPS